MIIDFQHHYTPRHLVEPRLRDGRATLIYTDGAPSYILHPLLYDLDEHVRMMEFAGIDAAMLSSGAAMDSADVEVCRAINDDLMQVEKQYPGKFYGLGHVPALGGPKALDEMRRCVGDLGFRGLVTTSYVQGQPLDDPRLDAYWAEAEKLGLYVFVHPALAPPGVPFMQDYDLLRSVGREFSLVMATVRLINGGVLDRFPELKVQFGHLCGGLSVLLGRIRGYQDREFWATTDDPRHGRLPARNLDVYLRERIWSDTGGFCGEINAVKQSLVELPASQIVFATDYPQEIRDPAKVKRFVDELKQLGADGAAILEGSAASLLPDAVLARG
jgi:predicted TIM-barrel fold metal-dependent hydrolase